MIVSCTLPCQHVLCPFDELVGAPVTINFAGEIGVVVNSFLVQKHRWTIEARIDDAECAALLERVPTVYRRKLMLALQFCLMNDVEKDVWRPRTKVTLCERPPTSATSPLRISC